MAYSSISKPGLHFSSLLYTGSDGTSAISGVGFQPDWTWIKCRSHGGGDAFENVLTDAVRGVNKTLVSDDSDAEATNNATGYLSVFSSDGFTVTGGDAVNGVARTYASWNWKANGQGSSNTDGSINTTYTSVNAAAGLSIVKYAATGSNATVGHGLSAVPKMILVKQLNTARDWAVYHTSMGNGNYMNLNVNGQSTSSSTHWNSTTPTSSVFSIGTSNQTNENGNDYIAYCFAEKKGYSKIGGYTGNGNANGPFIYTGFKPAFVMIKVKSGNNNHWFLFDKNRLGYNNGNSGNEYLKADGNDAESTNTNRINIFSNGFKCTTSNDGVNGNTDTYIYWAIAEEPLVANVGQSIPATAR